MLINWFTVIAQIVNFVVLVALLKHFLYAPLLRAIDSREKRIADRLAEASQKNQEAEQQMKFVMEKTSEVDHQRVRRERVNGVAPRALPGRVCGQRLILAQLVHQAADVRG